MASNLHWVESLLPAEFTISKSAEGTLRIQGFASTPATDIVGDTVEPSAFSWSGWPDLRLEHGSTPVGKLQSINTVKLADIGDPTSWAVIDAESGEHLADYPRASVPELQAGATGLFIVATVDDPQAVAGIRSGLLSGLSWRGMASAVTGFVGSVKRVLTDVILHEISLVKAPANTQARLALAKAAMVDENQCFDSMFAGWFSDPAQHEQVAKSSEPAGDPGNQVFDSHFQPLHGYLSNCTSSFLSDGGVR